ncbi:MAG: hypothetical protein QM811_31705 [Pirellulales bacterium]
MAERDKLTTLSDNSVMWVYFNVPEADYLAYKKNKDREDLKIELMLAGGSQFEHLGERITPEADFNSETGNIPFRAGFSEPGAPTTPRADRHGGDQPRRQGRPRDSPTRDI